MAPDPSSELGLPPWQVRVILDLAVPIGTYTSCEKKQLQNKSPLLSQGVLSDRRICKQEERK